MSFENLFFRILPRLILYPFRHLYGRTYLGQVLCIYRRAEAVFYLNNRVNVPLNLIENRTPENVFS